MSTFQEKLRQAMGPGGYELSMRRSVQTVILYEANRMMKEKLIALRPFQRKLAFFDQAKELLRETECIPAAHRADILWRTATSKEIMEPETAWKRMKMIEKDIEKIAEKVKPLCEEGKSHNEICDEYVQQQYEKISGEQGKPPADWEHAHNNLVMAYRMYYKGAELDPTFPEPGRPKDIVVPASKPKFPPAGATNRNKNNVAARVVELEQELYTETPEQRKEIIEEVREHLKLLKDFEGTIDNEVLEKRKRELFEALPKAPPSFAERAKQSRKN